MRFLDGRPEQIRGVVVFCVFVRVRVCDCVWKRELDTQTNTRANTLCWQKVSRSFVSPLVCVTGRGLFLWFLSFGTPPSASRASQHCSAAFLGLE